MHVFVCACARMHVCVCMHMRMRVCEHCAVCGGQSTVSDAIPLHPPFCSCVSFSLRGITEEELVKDMSKEQDP